MKHLKFKTIGLLLVAGLLCVNTNIFAQKGNGFGNGNGNGNGNNQWNGSNQGYCQNIPDLTEEQQSKIEKLRTAHLKEVQSNRNILNEKRAHLQTLRTADKVNMDAIHKTIDEISVIRTSLQKNREQHIQDVRILLTDDQRVYFDNHNRNQRHGQGYGRGNGQGRGHGYGNGNRQGRGHGYGGGNGCFGRNR